MADVPKRVLINGVEMLYGTSVKGSRDTSTSTTSTFTKVITNGTSKVSHSIDIGKVSYEGLTGYVELHNTITEMLDVPGMVTVIEEHYPENEDPFVVTRNYHGCIVDGDDYEISPEEHTVENLKFKAGKLDEKVEYL